MRICDRLVLTLIFITEELAFYGNRMSGTVPTSIGKLTELTSFQVRETAVGGLIPTEIGMCTKLTTLTAEISDFTGTLPTELASLTDLSTYNNERTVCCHGRYQHFQCVCVCVKESISHTCFYHLFPACDRRHESSIASS
jgi:hypothetical protein